MKKRIFIDSNVWDLLHDYNIDLSIELPKDEFQLLITGRISFEVKEIQDYSKKNFIDNAIENWPIEIDKLFSMADERFPIEEQRDGGFGFRLSDGFRPYFLHMKNQ